MTHIIGELSPRFSCGGAADYLVIGGHVLLIRRGARLVLGLNGAGGEVVASAPFGPYRDGGSRTAMAAPGSYSQIGDRQPPRKIDASSHARCSSL